MISNMQFLPGIGKSDHIGILFDFNDQFLKSFKNA